MSFYYGHVGLPVLFSAYAMDRSWHAIETSNVRQALELARLIPNRHVVDRLALSFAGADRNFRQEPPVPVEP